MPGISAGHYLKHSELRAGWKQLADDHGSAGT